VALLREMTCNLRHPMGLGHPVSSYTPDFGEILLPDKGEEAGLLKSQLDLLQGKHQVRANGCCKMKQCVAVCCSVLQCVAVCCSVLHSSKYYKESIKYVQVDIVK